MAKFEFKIKDPVEALAEAFLKVENGVTIKIEASPYFLDGSIYCFCSPKTFDELSRMLKAKETQRG